MANDLAGKIALVTGAGRGLGRAIAVALARAGARVALAGRTRATLEDAAAEIAALGGAAPVVQEIDVANPASIEAGISRVRDALGVVDILVNNAGIAESAALARTDVALWNRHFAVNATGPLLLTRSLVPAMVERRWGRVVNVASTAGLVGAPYVAAYTASKHALVGLTRAIAAETAGRGVTVNAVCPGYAATDLTWASARRIVERTGKSFDDAVAAMATFNSSRRLVEPETVAAAVVEFASDAAASRTGEALVID